MKFTKDIISLILYPIQSDGISRVQREQIPDIIEEYDSDKITELFTKRLSFDELSEVSKKIAEKDKYRYFQISKSIADLSNISMNQILAFAELGLLLNISEKDTGFNINIYDNNAVIDFEYHRTLINFSLVGSVIGFIPFIPIADFMILAPMQFGMVTKIANLYKFKIDSEQFVKMIIGTLGAGFVLKSSARIINRFIPFFGWMVNATVAFAGTYAIGVIAKNYIEVDGNLTEESIKEMWLKSYEEGKTEFSKFKDYIFEKKDELLKEFRKYKNNEENLEDSIYSDFGDAEEEIEPEIPIVKKTRGRKTSKQ